MYALICILFCFDVGELFAEEIEGMIAKFKTKHVCIYVIPRGGSGNQKLVRPIAAPNNPFQKRNAQKY